MTYQLTTCGVLRTEDSSFIPQDPTNRDWLDYQAWLLSGGQVLPLSETLEKTASDNSVTTLAKKWLTGIGRQL
jgi:hypothetical protein